MTAPAPPRRDAGGTLLTATLWVEHAVSRASRRSREILLGGLVVVVVVAGLVIATAHGETVQINDAAAARRTAVDLRPGLRHIRCERVSMAWSCAGLRRKRAWTCRVFLSHTTRQTITGSCHRGLQRR